LDSGSGLNDLLAARLSLVEALKLARQHKPDLILMDIRLPDVSGLEVTKWIKESDALLGVGNPKATTGERSPTFCARRS
jgi:CheY-like chemotaxis protein